MDACNCHGRFFPILSIIIIVIASCHLPVVLAQGNASQPVRFSVLEKSAPGTFVANIFDGFHLADLYPDPADRANLVFGFRFSSPDSAYFSINESTGIVVTSNVPVDRDVICAYVTSCVLQFQVQILPPRYFQVFNVFVVVVDVNDHTPTFTPSAIRINVSETDAPGKLFLLPGADDPDGGSDGIQGYRLEPNSTKFQLVVGSLADGSSDVRLRLTERLKRADAGSYSLLVLAHDGGRPARTGSLAVTVTVLDSSSSSSAQLSLAFENSTYVATVAESLPLGTSVLQVRAGYQGPSGGGDPSGVGQITYGIDRSTQQNQPMYFGIHNRTGVVYVASALDHEKQPVVLVTMTAADRSRVTSLPAYARVTVYVTDSNDNAPTITITTLTEDGVAEVGAKAPIDSFVAYVGVTDPDEGPNGQFNCSVNSTAFRLEPVYTDYKLKTAVRFDRSSSQYAVSVTCVDRGSPAMTSSVVVVVRVTSSGPAFVADRIQVDFYEGNRIGDRIVVLNVTTDTSDKDSSSLSFGFSPVGDSPPAAISVDASLGVVTSNVVFRYDVRRVYSYVVTVSDVRAAMTTATSTLVVNVLPLPVSAGSSTPEAVGGVVTPAPTPEGQGAGAGIRNTDTVIIAAVVCATVIVVVITVVVAAAIVCYRRNQQKALVSAAVQLAKGPSSVCSDGNNRLVRSVSSVSSSNGSTNGDKRDSKLGSIREESFEELHSPTSEEWPPSLSTYPAIPSTIGLDSSFGAQPKKGIYIRSVSHPDNHQQQQHNHHHHHRRRRSARAVTYNDRMAEDGSDASRVTDGESSSCCSGSLTDSGRGFSLQDDGCLAMAVNGNAQQYPHPPPPSQVLRQESDCSGASSTRPLVSSPSSATQKYPIENKIYITNHFRDALPRHSARAQPSGARRGDQGGPPAPGRTEPRRRSDYFDARSRAHASSVDPLRAAEGIAVAPSSSTGYRDTGEFTRSLYGGGHENAAFVRGTSSRKKRTTSADESGNEMAACGGPSRGYLTAASSGDEAGEFAANGAAVDGRVCDTFV